MKDYGNGYSIEELAAKYRLSVRTCYRALDDAKQKARIQLAQVEDSTHTNKKGAVNVEFKTPGKSGQKSASLKKLKIVKAADSMHSAWEKIS